MMKLEHGATCSCCQAGTIKRVRRYDWMRRLPRSKHYQCEACQARFLTIYGWAIRLPKRPLQEEVD